MTPEIEIVERLDGLFDIVRDGEIVREALFLSEAHSQALFVTSPGYITVVLPNRVRLVL